METKQEEDEDLNRQKSEISAEEWGGIFERLNSVNSESHELIIDQVIIQHSFLTLFTTGAITLSLPGCPPDHQPQ